MAQVTLTAQCALTVILLAAAGLFVNSLAHLNAVDPGFVAEGRVLAEVAPGLAGYDQAAAAAYVRRAVDALERVPGVRSVTYSSAAMGRLGNTTVVDVVGFEGAAASRRVSGRVEVGARFAETVGLRLLYGRDVAVLDSANAAPVALVNESFARNFFGRANAVARQFTLLGQRARHTIVGIVADARDRGVRSGPERVVYEAPFDHPEEGVTLTVRGDADTAAWLPAVERSLRDADRAVPIRRLRTAASDLDDALGRERLLGVLTSAFGGVAMFLVGLGLYGTVSGAVARRTSEIGIRMALGSTIGRVIWLVTRDACIAVIAGGAAGLLVSLLLTRLIQAQLFGVTATDPFVAAGVIALLAGTAVAAAAWPARRAARIDPAAALRAE